MIKKAKTIVLTEINDPELFKPYGKYLIFDKKIIIQQSVNELPDNIQLVNYMKNGIVKRELEKAIKNKKMDSLIYLLQGSDVEMVKEKILTMCSLAPIKNTIVINMVVL